MFRCDRDKVMDNTILEGAICIIDVTGYGSVIL